MPDIAIEVVYRHGGIDKLVVYAGLGIPEVWTWMEGQLVVFRLTDGQYERQEGSSFLPNLDLAELASFARRCYATEQTELVRQYRDALRAKP
jgi:Uma2 family endonuclease